MCCERSASGHGAKVVDLFEERWPASVGPGRGSLRQAVRGAPIPEAAEVGAYLRGGHVLLATMGASVDAPGSGEYVLGGDDVRTDGVWLWRGDLYFYLGRYHVCLPREFLDDVRRAGYVVPRVSRERLLALTHVLDAVLWGAAARPPPTPRPSSAHPSRIRRASVAHPASAGG